MPSKLPSLGRVDSRPFDVVLFDLGGVLIDFGGVGPMKALAGIESDEELWSRWLTCPWVRSFERGQCSAEDFAAGVVADWSLPIEPAAFLDEFATWPGGPLPDADELVRSVRQAVPVGCLSNTNAVHWDRNFARWPILDAFDHRFLSFELGYVKPDKDAFDRVAQLLRIPPGRVLFIDDNVLNVEGAIAAGFRAVQARGVEEARRALVAASILDA